ncbi:MULTISPECIES: iron donor protein CyaY [Telluria group]|uniref:Iron-sulfur cluster assembly protein CyaY n=1 Tax=Pseudoduganella violacea TaxID=1715466 RepID=A0A7W5BBP0_9BURK|nr:MULTISPECIES: iron donor protein CyaY [Telluria group]MBB3120207.1 CyaY protein [Pseudoduganella violacea]NVD99649.1 iron donor protein CyaY [Massilia sp. BJB1822]
MTESEFLDLADATLSAIEAAYDRLFEQDMLDVECSRSGNVLEIEFVHNGSKVIVNSQAAMKEIWVAARTGGFHYRQVDGKWRDTRDNTELFEALTAITAHQSGGAPVVISEQA